MTKRRAMTPARKRRAHERAQGICYHCMLPVPMFGPDVRYDHVVGLWMKDLDDEADLAPAHTLCDKPKTAQDATNRAKVKRIIRDRSPETRKRSKSPIQSPGFNKSLTRDFKGRVRKRAEAISRGSE